MQEAQSLIDDNPSKSNSTNNINDTFLHLLPLEIQLMIFLMLELRDLLALSMVDNFYQSTLRDPKLWNGLLKRDFLEHYSVLRRIQNIIEKQQLSTIHWRQEYLEAKKNSSNLLALTTSSNESPSLLGGENQAKTIQDWITCFKDKKVTLTNLKLACTSNGFLFTLEALLSLIKQDSKIFQGNLDQALVSALAESCKYNNKPAIAALLNAGANINGNIQGSKIKGLKPLHVAMSHSDIFLIQLLLENGANVSTLPHCPLIHFLLKNQAHFSSINSLSYFYTENFNSSYIDEESRIMLPIQVAIGNSFLTSDIRMIEWLVTNGSNINVAVFHQNECKPLLHYLLDLYQWTRNEKIALAALSFFLKNKANLEMKNKDGNSVLHYAIESLSFDQLEKIFNQLVDAGANLTTINLHGETLLHSFLKKNQDLSGNYLFDKNYRAILHYLIKRIDMNVKDRKGITPLDCAKSCMSAITIMIQMDQIRADIICEENCNILHLFAGCAFTKQFEQSIFRYNNLIHYLIGSGADLTQENISGKTPLQMAIDSNNHLAACCFIANGASTKNLQLNTAIQKIKKLIHCSNYIRKMMTGLTATSFHQKFLSSRSSIIHYLDMAIACKPFLAGQLLLRQLRSEMLTDSQQQKLVITILNSKCVEINFFRELAILAREGRTLKLPGEVIFTILKKYLAISREKFDYGEQFYIEEARSMLEDYLASIYPEQNLTFKQKMQ